MTTGTGTSTFSLTNAKHIAAKIMTDLELLDRAYPSAGLTDERIADFGDEAAGMLNAGYLGTVTYGFKKGDDWIVALRYTARNDGTLVADDRAGKIPRGVDVAGAFFYSYLTYSSAWSSLTADLKAAFVAGLPIQRTGAPEPGTSGGYWTSSTTYSSNGSGVTRQELRPT